MSSVNLIIFLVLLVCLSAYSKEIQFSNYEKQNVHSINKLLDFPFAFEHDGYWNSRTDRYLFYAMGLTAMKNPLTRYLIIMSYIHM